ITGPSASGSLNGTPSSITSAPASMAASTTSRVVATSGSPQVTYATRDGRFGKFSGMIKVGGAVSRTAWKIASVEFQGFPQNADIFIASAGNVDNDHVRLLHLRSTTDDLGDSMRRLECRNDPFCTRQ